MKEAVYIRLALKGLKMNKDEGKELSPLWIGTISQARKKPPHEPHSPRETRPRDNRPPLKVRRRAPTTSPAPRQPTPPPPAVFHQLLLHTEESPICAQNHLSLLLSCYQMEFVYTLVRVCIVVIAIQTSLLITHTDPLETPNRWPIVR